MTTEKINGSLCRHDFAAGELRRHRQEEPRHPEWTRNDPPCQMCWDYYRNLPTN